MRSRRPRNERQPAPGREAAAASEPKRRRILLAGASGVVGAELARELRARGWWVRALTRDARRVTADFDEVFVGDLLRSQTLEGACDDVDTVFSCAGAPTRFLRWGTGSKTSFRVTDDFGNRQLLAAAQEAGVRRFGYVSVYGGRFLGGIEYIRAHESFAIAVRTVPGLVPLIVRPTPSFSSLAPLLEQARKGAIRLPSDGTARVNPVHEADVAAACADALEGGEQEVDVGGPDTLTWREIAELAFEAVGGEPKIRTTPDWRVAMGLSLRRFTGRHNSDWARFVVARARPDLIAPATGTRTLADYFRALA